MTRNLKITLTILILIIAILSVWYYFYVQKNDKKYMNTISEQTIKLPDPKRDSSFSLEKAIAGRQSVREYKDEALSLEEVGQLLWAAQGLRDNSGKRTVPSAGALYPLEIYVMGSIENVKTGLYHYLPDEHAIDWVCECNFKKDLPGAAYGQDYLDKAPTVILIAGVYERTTIKYGDRGVMYVHMEAGHAGQNIYLQASALDLGTVTVGGFEKDKVKELVGLPEEEEPLYLMPVGKPVN